MDALNAGPAAGGWVTEGAWVLFNQSTQPEFHPLIGYVFEVTPCARAAVLVPLDTQDEVQVIEPEQVQVILRLDEVKNALTVLSGTEIGSITFDRAERQLRIDRARECSHA